MPPRKRPRRFPLSWQGMSILSVRGRDQPCAAGWKRYWIVNPPPEISGKRLELLKEIVPKLSRVAVLGT